jgi:hypothetical protein
MKLVADPPLRRRSMILLILTLQQSGFNIFPYSGVASAGCTTMASGRAFLVLSFYEAGVRLDMATNAGFL